MWSYNYEYGNYLAHADRANHKYIKKEMKNGKWRYYYEDDSPRVAKPNSAKTTTMVKKQLKTARGVLQDGPASLASSAKSGSSNKEMSSEEYLKSLGYDVEKEKAKYDDKSRYNNIAKELKKYRDEVDGVISDNERKQLDELAASALGNAKEYDKYVEEFKRTGNYEAKKKADHYKAVSAKRRSEYVTLYEEFKKRSKVKAALDNAKDDISEWLYKVGGQKKSDQIKEVLNSIYGK